MKRDSFAIMEFRNHLFLSGFGSLLFIFILTLIISGCGGGGHDEGLASSSSEPFIEGVFIDSPVEGLEYETATRTGMTDVDGTFMYHDGDTIRFYVGDTMLGEATAKSMMTPVDLVEGAADETHPAVVNMARFLQTLDDDMDPENGITITEAMSNAMTDHMINFDMPTIEFEYDVNVMMAMDAVNDLNTSGPVRMMVSAEDAKTHLGNSIDGMMGNGYAMMGSGSSESFIEGIFVDSPVEGLGYETMTHTGLTDENGTFMYHEGDTIMFYAGDIMLGEAMAGPVITPIDMIEGATDETHPAVINMVRFLQTLDEDMNPENGITITDAMSKSITGHMINFDMDPDQFEYDPDVVAVMDSISETDPYGHMRTMVSEVDAVSHFTNSMNNMMSTGGGMM